jgi:hypothetical protein
MMEYWSNGVGFISRRTKAGTHAIRRLFAACCFLMGAGLLPAQNVPHFSVLASGTEPLSWRGDLLVSVNGLTPTDRNSGKWQIWINGISFKIENVFLGPGPDSDGNSSVRFSLSGAEIPTGRPDSEVADCLAAAIRAVAPSHWADNLVRIQISCNGHDLTELVPPSTAGPVLVSFRLISSTRKFFCALAAAALIIVFWWAGANTAALRDPEPFNPDFRQRTFSLARVQLAFWTAIVVTGFIYLFLVNGATDGILNDTALWLLGISSTTAAAAQFAGGNGAAPTNSGPALPQRHVNILIDILSDAQGVNIHRLQMAVWTVVFGGVVASRILSCITFPHLDNTAYILMGISSGTYVWFKRTEK